MGLNPRGEKVKGNIEADSERDMIRLLKDRSVFVTKSKPGENAFENVFFAFIKRYGLFLNLTRYVPVGSSDLVIFFRQVALMIRAGFTLVSALEVAEGMQRKYSMQRALKRISKELRRGEPFSACMAGEKKVFTPMMVNLIASGEKSGNLDYIMEKIADNIEQAKELKRNLVMAMFYPGIVFISSIALVILVVVYVIPKFTIFLTSRGTQLPASTQMLMDISDWVIRYGVFYGGLAGIGLFLTLAAYTTPKGKYIIDGVLLRVPIIGKILVFTGVASASWTMAMLLESGVTALDALRITKGVVGNAVMAKKFAIAGDALLDGVSLSKALTQKFIPDMVRHMVAVGENSGQLDYVMNALGEYYKKELVRKTNFLAAAVEPALILGVGGIAFFVYKSLFEAVMAVSKGGM